MHQGQNLEAELAALKRFRVRAGHMQRTKEMKNLDTLIAKTRSELAQQNMIARSLDPDTCEVCGAHPTDCGHTLSEKLRAQK